MYAVSFRVPLVVGPSIRQKFFLNGSAIVAQPLPSGTVIAVSEKKGDFKSVEAEVLQSTRTNRCPTTFNWSIVRQTHD